MPKYHECAQYSDEWDRLRIGIPTSSSFEKIITPLGKIPRESTTKTYAHGLIAEKILGRRMDTFMSPWMERGAMVEEDAIAQYEVQRNIDTQRIGFVTDDDHQYGCSPDRLIGEDGLLEIKVPKPNTHIGYLIDEDLFVQEYYPQVQGQLFITQRKWVDLMAFHHEMPPLIKRVYRNEKYLGILQDQMADFVEYMRSAIIKIAAKTAT